VYNEDLFRVFEYGAMLVELICGGKAADDQGSVRLDTMSRWRKVDVDQWCGRIVQRGADI
jgi:hypothetical protein